MFTYEMSSYPTSLFDDRASTLIKLVPEANIAVFPPGIVHILDRGELTWMVVWAAVGCETYGSLCDRYVSYVLEKYYPAVIAFDYYEAHVH